MTKIISILIVALVLFGGWQLYLYWQEVQNEHDSARKAAVTAFEPRQLPGMPYELEESLSAAEKQGPAALKNWLQNQGRYAQDPRRAWIELDYCVLVARDNPQEARRVFAAVKQRTPHSSPVWRRIQELAKSYE